MDTWSFVIQQNGDEENEETQLGDDVVKKQKSKLTKRVKLGEFQNMGFSEAVYEGILKIGYKYPTPIQRSAIPVIISGQDVVAMARTGSGKTACFLLPMFEALKEHSDRSGARALILEPTRELAEQTLKFAQKLGKFTGLHCTLVVGGDSMDEQFGALHKHPDIIIATPGRLMHMCVEMNLRLSSVQYVVFDEADRLFELGFQEQLEDILSRLAPARQTLLFSATLPKMLADFAKAGLTNPALVRLDKDDKLSEQLQLAFVSVPPMFKLHVLLFLLRYVVRDNEQAIVFAATQHHVQYLEHAITGSGFKCTFLYSDLDPTARKINSAKFQKKIVNILVATDIAARGIDIPNLDYVINYNFPGSAKIFVHRVGRAARAGNSGVAISFVSLREEAYMFDLHKFLGRSVMFSPKPGQKPFKMILHDCESGIQNQTNSDDKCNEMSTETWNFQFGTVPDDVISSEAAGIAKLRNQDEFLLLDSRKDNAFKLYERTLPKPSRVALKEQKEAQLLCTPGQHPLLQDAVKKYLYPAIQVDDEMEEKRLLIMEQLRNIRGKKTIFELGSAGSKDTCRRMKLKRKKDDEYIENFHKKLAEKRQKLDEIQQFKLVKPELEQMNDDDVFYEFPYQIHAKDEIQRTIAAKDKKRAEEIEQQQIREKRELKKREKFAAKFGTSVSKSEKKAQEAQRRKEEHDTFVKSGWFIPYVPEDYYSEQGYSVNDNFSAQSNRAQLDLAEDHRDGLMRQRNIKRYDSKKDKFVAVNKKMQEKKIVTESGKRISASYKTGRYEEWLRRNKLDAQKLNFELPEDNDGTEQLQPDENVANDSKTKQNKGRFQVLATKTPAGKVHPLLQAKQKHLNKYGTVIREEVRNEQQIKKHKLWQARYEADRKRGRERKKANEKKKRKARKHKK